MIFYKIVCKLSTICKRLWFTLQNSAQVHAIYSLLGLASTPWVPKSFHVLLKTLRWHINEDKNKSHFLKALLFHVFSLCFCHTNIHSISFFLPSDLLLNLLWVLRCYIFIVLVIYPTSRIHVRYLWLLCKLEIRQSREGPRSSKIWVFPKIFDGFA